jgi:hypothetical protein
MPGTLTGALGGPLVATGLSKVDTSTRLAVRGPEEREVRPDGVQPDELVDPCAVGDRGTDP